MMFRIQNSEFRILLLISIFEFLISPPRSFGAQQPQAQQGQPIYPVNAKYVNGVAPGYWPTAGSGLTLNISAGTASCGNPLTPVFYAGGALPMAASRTNYVYLDPVNACAPASNTSGFSLSEVPLALVVTSPSKLTSVTDLRPFGFKPAPCTADASGNTVCAPFANVGAATASQAVSILPQTNAGDSSHFGLYYGPPTSAFNSYLSTNGYFYQQNVLASLNPNNASTLAVFTESNSASLWAPPLYSAAFSTNPSGMRPQFIGGEFEAYQLGAGATSLLIGSGGYTEIDAGSVAQATALASNGVAAVGGAVANAYGLLIGSNSASSGTISNNVGLQINDQTAGQSNWALKTGKGLVSFGDNVAAPSLNQVFYASAFTGADAGAKISACIAALPATGGVCDARAMTGTQAFTSQIIINKPATVLFTRVTLAYTGTSDPFAITSNGVSLIGDPGWGTAITSNHGWRLSNVGNLNLDHINLDFSSNPASTNLVLDSVYQSEFSLTVAAATSSTSNPAVTLQGNVSNSVPNASLNRFRWLYVMGGSEGLRLTGTGTGPVPSGTATENVFDHVVIYNPLNYFVNFLQYCDSNVFKKIELITSTPTTTASGIAFAPAASSDVAADGEVIEQVDFTTGPASGSQYAFVVGPSSGNVATVGFLGNFPGVQYLSVPYPSATKFTLYDSTDAGLYNPASNQQTVVSPTILRPGRFLALPNTAASPPPANGFDFVYGSTTGLTLTAGGSNRNVVTQPSGSGYTLLNGNVGAGTSNPTGPNGATPRIHALGSVPGGALVTVTENADASAGSVAALDLKTGASSNYWQWFARNGDMFAGIANVADYLVIKNGGNVGIGTPSPSSLLSVGSSSQFQVNSSGGVTTTAVSNSGTMTVGGGSTINAVNFYATGSITPTSVGAQSCSDQTFSVTGLAAGDKLGQVIPPGALGNVSVLGYVSATNTLLLHFCNPSTSPVTPPAGVYSVVDFR